MKAYKYLSSNYKRLKNSEIKSRGIMCLPLYPELNKNEVKIICKKIKDIIKNI